MNNEESSLQARMTFGQRLSDQIARTLTRYFGTVAFLGAFLILVVGWMLINLEILPVMEVFDEYPFIMLVMIVQLFEVVLSIVVLISQNRAEKIANVRQQVDLEINVRAENEITKILQMLDEIRGHIGISRPDKELDKMKEKINLEEVKQEVENELVEENIIQEERESNDLKDK